MGGSKMKDEAVKAEPVVRSFLIKGLHGYKDVRLDFTHAVKIVIAENGAGKTTILSALQAFLQRDFAKLSTLRFDSIECELAGVSEPLVLKRANLGTSSERSVAILAELSELSRIDESDLRQVIREHIPLGGPVDIHASAALRRLSMESPYGQAELSEKLLEARASIEQIYPDETRELIGTLKGVLEGYDILYLPTFRRIERPMSIRDKRKHYARRHPYGVRGQIDRPEQTENRSIPDSDINFGLADVEDRLSELTESIQRRSNLGYRQISAAIIDDLISGRFVDKPLKNTPLPTIEDLRLFFSRIQQSPHDSEQRLAAVTRLYDSKEIEGATQNYLRYFLTMLSTVVSQTKGLEANIQHFVDQANEYLNQSGDEKSLQYDATRMKVLVKNTWTNAEVKLDDLSSGEKQVISLFSNMYLYTKKKIVLIDEPELSLSMEWQRRLLPDVVRSPNCAQLLAITHSPFIFDNELDPYASPLNIERRRTHAE